jgi:hypothetical protein
MMKLFLVKRQRRSVLNGIAHFTTAPIDSTITGLKKASYNIRITFLRYTGFLSLSSARLSRRYVNLVNMALDQNIIEPDAAKKLADRFKESKRVKLIFDEQINRLVIDDSNLVSDPQALNKFFRDFKIKEKELQNEIKSNYLTKVELETISNPRHGVNKENASDVMTFIHTCRSFKLATQSLCLNSLGDLFNTSVTSVYKRRYIKVRKSTEWKRNRATNSVLKELRRDDITIKKEDIPPLKKVEILDQVRAFRSINVACRSQVKTTARVTARNRLLTAVIAGETLSASALYISNNKEEELDEDWVKGLGENVAINIVSGFIHANIASSAAGFAKKTAAEWLISAARDIDSSLIYSKHLAPSPEKLKEEVHNLLSDQNFYSKLESMLVTAENEDIYKKVEDELSRYHQFGEEELSDEQREESLDALTEILAYQAYISFSSGLIQLGDIGHDYYAFNRVWDLGSSAANIGVTLFIYSAMCRAENQLPKAQVIAGATAYAIYKAASSRLYEKTREISLGF